MSNDYIFPKGSITLTIKEMVSRKKNMNDEVLYVRN